MRKSLTRFAGMIGLVGGTAAAAGAAPPDTGRQVLPADVVPSHYELSIVPDTDRLTFRATVSIDVAAMTPTRQIVLNAKGLSFDATTLDGKPASAVTLDPALGRATLTFPGGVAAGAHKLAIAYHGAIGRDTFGFFAMDYDTMAGKRRTLATNFEPAGARMLLPCWDEPARKATFTVAIDAPTDRLGRIDIQDSQAG